MPKGVYKRTPNHLKNLKIQMLEVRTQKFGFQKGHQLNIEEKSPNWKGEKVGYSGLHKWVRKYKKIPKKCQICKKIKKLQASNISGLYKRDLSDWEYLCAKCHVYKDKTYKNLKSYHNHATMHTMQ